MMHCTTSGTPSTQTSLWSVLPRFGQSTTCTTVCSSPASDRIGMQILVSSLLLGCLSIYSLEHLHLFPYPLTVHWFQSLFFHVRNVSKMSGVLCLYSCMRGRHKQLFGSSMCFSATWLGSEPAFSFWDPDIIIISVFAKEVPIYLSVEDSPESCPGILPAPGCLCSGSRGREVSWVWPFWLLVSSPASLSHCLGKVTPRPLPR